MARRSSPRITSRAILNRLVRDPNAPASARRWLDPVTGESYSQYARQVAQNRGLTPEQAAQARRAGKYATTQRAIIRGVPWDDALERAKQRTGKTKKELLADPNFYGAIRGATRGKTSRRDRALRYFGLEPDDLPADWDVSPDAADLQRAA